MLPQWTPGKNSFSKADFHKSPKTCNYISFYHENYSQAEFIK